MGMGGMGQDGLVLAVGTARYTLTSANPTLRPSVQSILMTIAAPLRRVTVEMNSAIEPSSSVALWRVRVAQHRERHRRQEGEVAGDDGRRPPPAHARGQLLAQDGVNPDHRSR